MRLHTLGRPSSPISAAAIYLSQRARAHRHHVAGGRADSSSTNTTYRHDFQIRDALTVRRHRVHSSGASSPNQRLFLSMRCPGQPAETAARSRFSGTRGDVRRWWQGTLIMSRPCGSVRPAGHLGAECGTRAARASGAPVGRSAAPRASAGSSPSSRLKLWYDGKLLAGLRCAWINRGKAARQGDQPTAPVLRQASNLARRACRDADSLRRQC
jgi:hypothetical protein